MEAIDRRHRRVKCLFQKIEEALEAEKENCGTRHFSRIVELLRNCIKLYRDVSRLHSLFREGRLTLVDLRIVAEDLTDLKEKCNRLLS